MSEVITEQQLADKARHLAQELQHGVVHLCGDVGVGKTTFCSWFIQALIPGSIITSPTYPIIQQYQNQDTTIYHIDLYRIRHGMEAEELALDELVTDNNILLIEWPEKGGDFSPQADYVIRLEHKDTEHRSYQLEPCC